MVTPLIYGSVCSGIEAVSCAWHPVGRKVAKDAPRYKALGNSMAVPVLSWIGRRMLQVDELDAL